MGVWCCWLYLLVFVCSVWLVVDVRFFAVVWKEEDMFVVREVFTGVTTQGGSIEEAVNNLREALELYLEEFPELREEIGEMDLVGLIHVEVAKALG